MSLLFFFFFFFFFFFSPAFSLAAAAEAAEAVAADVKNVSSSEPWCKSEEQDALLDFRRSITSPNPVFDSWEIFSSCCTWKGIQCSSSSLKDSDDSRRFTQLSNGYRVRSLSLPDLQLTGQIPSSISQLLMLQALDLSGNQLTGSLPPQIISLTHLKLLDLSRNNISSDLPSVFRHGFPAIEHLNISDNNLTGEIPAMAASASSLQSVDFSFNFFSTMAASFPCASFINISNNMLLGSALAAFSHCSSSIQVLNAAGNQLNSSLQSDSDFFAGSASDKLRVLDLSNNNISGFIPDEIGSLPSLEKLFLHYNNLQGKIPHSISNCTRIKTLNLRNNFLGGALTVNFTRLANLTTLELSFNLLTGDIPSGIAGCRLLTTLGLAKNGFSGNIPASFGGLKRLEFLTVSGNELSGPIPESLQQCDALVVLVLSKNRFDSLPQGNFSGFGNLQLLAVGNAGLSGEIPAWIANSSKLQVLDLSWNKLDGAVPAWIGDLEHLFYLDLSNNSLSGLIPPRVFMIKRLQLDDDEEDDSSSDELRPVANTLFVKHKSDSQALQYKHLTSFPPSIILSGNRLSGPIPDIDFGLLKNLVSLDLSGNRLEGRIPASLGNVSDLESLDLSWNQLNGSIPQSLVKLTFLAFFNVSFNRLSGPVPSTNQFASFSNSSYAENAGLCGVPLSTPCPARSPLPDLAGSKKINRGAMMGIAISISLGLTALFAAMLIISFSRRGRGRGIPEQNFKEMTVAQMMNLTVTMFGKSYCLMTVADLINATNNFDAANIIGCGGFGLVFKARLPDGKVVAVKRLTSEDGGPQMEKEFDSELSTLGKITHPNLVALEGYCRLGFRDRLLIYSYMENGSLDYWLHERSDGGSRLTWRHRLAILRETARGLEYLHCGCVPHIVHRDIKSSNILLDGDLHAHVADFGLARVILPSDTHVTTELVGTLGYIPPEYAESSVASLRGDVYSFGVLTLEVLSRRRPVDACRRGGVRDLVPWVRAMQGGGRGIEILDPLMLQNYSSPEGGNVVEEMLRVLDVACYCVDVCPQRRPAIEEVVGWLDAVGYGRRRREEWAVNDG